MTVIVKAGIIADVNENLLLGLAVDSTDLDRAILKTLTDMSNKGLLVDTDATQTLSDGSKTLTFPTGYRSVINITLTDLSNNENYPLKKLPGGHKEYRENIAFGGGLVNPEWFSEFEGLFYLYGQASKSYTVLIEYRKDHPKTAGAIEFTTEFENLMFAGVTFWKAAALNRSTSIAIWGPIYSGLLREAKLNRRNQPSVMLG